MIEIREALEKLKLYNDGFGYESGVPLPYQQYVMTVNKVLVLELEALAEIIEILKEIKKQCL